MVQRTSAGGDGKQSFDITIIDWEDAGWYPDYWEYCMANIIPMFRQEWLAILSKALPAPGYEYTVMQMIWHVLYY
jgi:hypothetical protein